MAKTLIVRYHRLGDAIIILPLIYDMAIKYPEDEFTVLSSSKLEPLFKLMPQNVLFMPMVMKNKKARFRALRYTIEKQILLLKLKAMNFDKVAVLQGESFDRRLCKRLSKTKAIVEQIAKPEFDSDKRLSDRCNDGLTIVNLHKNKLASLGYTGLKAKFNPTLLKLENIDSLYKKLSVDNSKKILAVAPFSLVDSKIYPIEKMEAVIAYFANKSHEFELLVLGGGEKEKAIVNDWNIKYPRIINLINRISFSEEVSIIAKSNLVLTMDSANLHLASLLNTPVISIWGTTLPKCGYYPNKESLDMTVFKDLPCQPCSLWGDKECDLAQDHKYSCLDIDPKIIIEKIEKVISSN